MRLEYWSDVIHGRDLVRAIFTWVDAKIELFPVVQPDLGQPGVIVIDYLGSAARKSVRGRLPEDVAYVGAGSNHQLAPAHPDLKTHAGKLKHAHAKAKRVETQNANSSGNCRLRMGTSQDERNQTS